MGLKHWIAKNIAGPDAYGKTMGRTAVENGFAFGRALYSGRGIRPDQSTNHVFGTGEAMTADGYAICSPDLNPNPPVENSSKLSTLTAAAGIAFATSVAMTAAENLFRVPENRSRFHRAVTSAVSHALVERCRDDFPDLPIQFRPLGYCRDVPPQLLNHFLRLGHGYHLSQMLNPYHPGTGDLLEVYLSEISRQYQDGTVAFMEGFFHSEAIKLMAETVSAVTRAANDSRW